MRITRRIVLLWNMMAMMPIIFYMLFWGLIALSFLGGVIFFLVVLIFMLVYAIFTAVKLKVRILRDARDHRLKPIKHLYKEATRVNIYGYLIFYPMMFATVAGSAIGGIIVIVACALAIPLLLKILKLKKRYEFLKEQMAIGKIRCKNCRVSLFYYQNTKQWVCYQCGDRFDV